MELEEVSSAIGDLSDDVDDIKSELGEIKLMIQEVLDQLMDEELD